MEAAKPDDGIWGGKSGKAVGWVVGAGLGYYTGIHLLIPLAISAAANWVGKKFLSPQKLPFLPSVAVQTGQTVWIAFGLLILGTLNLNILDVVFFSAGLTWLVLKPGLPPIIFLTILQAIGLLVNAISFTEVAVGSVQHKALVVHIAWRIMALYLMWTAYTKIRIAPPENAPGVV